MDDNVTKILEKQTELMELLAKKEDHTKTPAQWGTNVPLHGSGGIFAVPGLERDVISTHMRPYGITAALPRLPSVFVDPRFGSLTGFTATSGSQPDHACDDAPTGYLKGCNLTARFGRIRFDTNTIDMNDVMLKLHRGDFTDLNLRGQILGMTGLTPSGLNASQILNVTTMAEMVTVGVAFERELSRQIWQGVTTVANEFPGLDVQIATGQKDADTGTLCPALDSDVKDFAYDLVCGEGRDIVEYMSSMMWYLENIAWNTGLTPVNYLIVMRPGLWQELTNCWPCRVNTACTLQTSSDAQITIDGFQTTQLRDAMRNGLFIDINGKRYPVLLDTGIHEETPADNANILPGQYASTIYAIPLSIQGGFNTTYMEYVDYREAQPDVSLLRGLEEFFWTDNGLYSWAVEQVKWCYKLAAKIEPRVILRTPQLAGRIDSVRYSPLQHERDSDPSSDYFKDGGVSLRSAMATPYAAWTSR